MEISIILNIVFISLVTIGFICYQIWIGSRLVRLKEQVQRLENNLFEVEKLQNKNLNDLEDSLMGNLVNTELSIMDEIKENKKQIDRVDSRLDEKIKSVYLDLVEKIK